MDSPPLQIQTRPKVSRSRMVKHVKLAKSAQDYLHSKMNDEIELRLV